MKDTKRRHWFFFARESSASTLSAPDSVSSQCQKGRGVEDKAICGRHLLFLGLAACPSTAALLALSCRTREKLERRLREPV